MARAEIHVDIFNPGQVLACLGFMEAAEILLGDAEGGFDWSTSAEVRFVLKARGEENPFGVVLEFLAGAEIIAYAPISSAGSAEQPGEEGGIENDEPAESDPKEAEPDEPPNDSKLVQIFPAPTADRMALPVRLYSKNGKEIVLTHWADGSSRNPFKLYSGNRTAEQIVRAMSKGVQSKSKKKTIVFKGIQQLMDDDIQRLESSPFQYIVPMGGSFNFDTRGAWTSIDMGFSPNEHKDLCIEASPVVELLAAIGLENARPIRMKQRVVRYAVWEAMAPLMLARALISTCLALPPQRFLVFTLGTSGKNSIFTTATEES